MTLSTRNGCLTVGLVSDIPVLESLEGKFTVVLEYGNVDRRTGNREVAWMRDLPLVSQKSQYCTYCTRVKLLEYDAGPDKPTSRNAKSWKTSRPMLAYRYSSKGTSTVRIHQLRRVSQY